MKVNDIDACSFHKWYKTFEDSTIPSVILPIPIIVLKYLRDNGPLVLPKGSYKELQYPHDTNEDSDAEGEDWDSDTEVAVEPNLNEFTQIIKNAIKQLGGIAFPKLNWSSPKDAAWINFNRTLQCSAPGDVYLLLKSSDFITHDLNYPYENCSEGEVFDREMDYHLVLRKWTEINPADEFRCFVKDLELIGISQRETSQYYYSLHEDQDRIVEDIIDFWEQRIRNRFSLLSYAFDVHRPKNGQVILIDFGPFGITTDSLLFTWKELRVGNNDRDVPTAVDSNRVEDEHEGDVEPEFRYIRHSTGVQPSPYARYGLPVDVLTYSGEPSDILDLVQSSVLKPGKETLTHSEDNKDQEDDSTAPKS